MKQSFSKVWLLALIPLSSFGCSSAPEVEKPADWCAQPVREVFRELPEIAVPGDWFKVYEVGDSVYAIAEPYNFQEVISYLILGQERALLFDTGMGLDSISPIVKALTPLPVTVINSHTHYDHIGGNYEFDRVLALPTEYTRHWAAQGWTHEQVKGEVTPEALCMHHLAHPDTANYHIKPFKIAPFLADEQVIDLGQRQITVLSVPGHTPDGIALLDRQAGYLWTGDVFYEAPIWLFFDGTDLDAYETSIQRLAAISPGLRKVFPAHNTPVAEPVRLVELVRAFEQVVSGAKKPLAQEPGSSTEGSEADTYAFDHFSFLIRRDFLAAKRAGQ